MMLAIVELPHPARAGGGGYKTLEKLISYCPGYGRFAPNWSPVENGCLARSLKSTIVDPLANCSDDVLNDLVPRAIANLHGRLASSPSGGRGWWFPFYDAKVLANVVTKQSQINEIGLIPNYTRPPGVELLAWVVIGDPFDPDSYAHGYYGDAYELSYSLTRGSRVRKAKIVLSLAVRRMQPSSIPQSEVTRWMETHCGRGASLAAQDAVLKELSNAIDEAASEQCN